MLLLFLLAKFKAFYTYKKS